MTPTKWLSQARANRDALRSLIDRFHPQRMGVDDVEMPITAPGAEASRRQVVSLLRVEHADLPPAGPRFDAALEEGDVGTVYGLLNDAWFGVPESTACWGVRGFSQAVALLEDPPFEESES